MGLFGFGKNKDVIDLAEHYRRKKELESRQAKKVSQETPAGPQANEGYVNPFGFFDASQSSSSADSSSYTSNSDDFVDLGSSQTSPDKRRKLAKRILDMTTKLEDISNQVYHLQQRLEVIERKLNVQRFD